MLPTGGAIAGLDLHGTMVARPHPGSEALGAAILAARQRLERRVPAVLVAWCCAPMVWTQTWRLAAPARPCSRAGNNGAAGQRSELVWRGARSGNQAFGLIGEGRPRLRRPFLMPAFAYKQTTFDRMLR